MQFSHYSLDSHGENGSTAADVEDDLVLEDVLVLHDGIHVRPRANLIFLYNY